MVSAADKNALSAQRLYLSACDKGLVANQYGSPNLLVTNYIGGA
tara:strand:- start:305 stop:436 length:132 start_codon:yes stop_codon:yes gene_type:complete